MTEASGARGRWRVPESRFITGAVLLLGLLSLGLLLATRAIDRRLVQRDDARLERLAQIRLAIATSHLWVEEYVTGDAVDLARIRSDLLQAEQTMRSMLERRGSLRDARLLERAERVLREIRAFREITERRLADHERGQDVGIGSATDVAYDAAFEHLFVESTELQQSIESDRELHRRRAELLFRTIVITWIGIVVLAMLGLVRLQRQRAAAEQALRASRERLIEVQKMEALGRLAGGIAHDINNYLAAIRCTGELLHDQPTRERIRGKVEAIVRLVDKASELIGRLLAFARQQPVRPRVLSLDAALDASMLTLGRLLGAEFEIQKRAQPGTWSVCVDPAQLDQVVLNLLVNARDAMPAGGTIVVALENREVRSGDPLGASVPAPGEYVALSVEDRGTGIAPEDLGRIFEPFFSTKPGSKGTGLGLSTVYAILEQAGGGIAVESQPGEGSRFTALLPRAAG